MGTDAFAFIEFRSREDDKIWAFNEGPLFIGRHYALFSALAGVRSPGEVPLFLPRGLPAHMSDALVENYFSWVLDSGEEQPMWWHGWTETRSEADDRVARDDAYYVPYGDEPRRLVPRPELHSTTWLDYKELNQALRYHKLQPKKCSPMFRAARAAMKQLAEAFGSRNVRLVVWFHG